MRPASKTYASSTQFQVYCVKMTELKPKLRSPLSNSTSNPAQALSHLEALTENCVIRPRNPGQKLIETQQRTILKDPADLPHHTFTILHTDKVDV